MPTQPLNDVQHCITLAYGKHFGNERYLPPFSSTIGGLGNFKFRTLFSMLPTSDCNFKACGLPPSTISVSWAGVSDLFHVYKRAEAGG